MESRPGKRKLAPDYSKLDVKLCSKLGEVDGNEKVCCFVDVSEPLSKRRIEYLSGLGVRGLRKGDGSPYVAELSLPAIYALSRKPYIRRVVMASTLWLLT